MMDGKKVLAGTLLVMAGCLLLGVGILIGKPAAVAALIAAA